MTLKLAIPVAALALKRFQAAFRYPKRPSRNMTKSSAGSSEASGRQIRLSPPDDPHQYLMTSRLQRQSHHQLQWSHPSYCQLSSCDRLLACRMSAPFCPHSLQETARSRQERAWTHTWAKKLVKPQSCSTKLCLPVLERLCCAADCVARTWQLA